ncbi:MAG TPA: ABC transporter ATP-binding protein [bacterium]|nr:ABC transporter ATP-binding protein [bacterium]
MLLEVESLTKAFGGLVAVSRVSFRVGSGEVVGLLGPNASGKTTILNLIAGALRPDAGQVRLDARDITLLPASARARLGIARTFQLVRALPKLSVLDNVLIGRLYGRDGTGLEAARAESLHLLDSVGLRDKGQLRASQLTLTDQKRMELARALATRPKVLLLDEPLGGLNPTEVRTAVAQLRQVRTSGVTVVLVEHNVRAVRALCDHLIMFNYGEIVVEGGPDDVLAHPAVIEAYLGKSSASNLAAFS